MSLIDKDGRATDPFAAYFQNQCNALWNTGVEVANKFTYETLPVGLNYVAMGTSFWAPGVSAAASGLSTVLTIQGDLKKNGGIPTADSFVSAVTTAVGSQKNRVVSGIAAATQIIYDETKGYITNGNKASSENVNQAARDEETKAALESIKKRLEEQKKKDEEEQGNLYSPVSTYRQ